MLNNIKNFLTIIKKAVFDTNHFKDFRDNPSLHTTSEHSNLKLVKTTQDEQESLMDHFLGLAKEHDFKKLGEFLLNEKFEQKLHKLNPHSYEIFLEASFKLFSNESSEEQKLAYLKIMENNIILENIVSNHYNFLKEEATDESAYFKHSFIRSYYDRLLSNHDDYNKITSKMFQLNSENELVYLGLDGLSEVERKLVLNQFQIIEHLHNKLEDIHNKENPSKPYTRFGTVVLPINDLMMFGFLHENPKFHGSPILLEHYFLTSANSGTSHLLKNLKSSEEYDKDTLLVAAIKINNQYQTQFKNRDFSDETSLRKPQQRNGNTLEENITFVSMPSDMAEKLKSKQNELLASEKNNPTSNLDSVIKANKKS